jgi:RNA polymerase sigma factor (sigma-70 family)
MDLNEAAAHDEFRIKLHGMIRAAINRWARKSLRRAALMDRAEDRLVSKLYRLLKDDPTLSTISNIEGYLDRAARNELITASEKAKAEPKLVLLDSLDQIAKVEPAPNPEDRAERVQRDPEKLWALVEAGRQKLGDREQDVFRLFLEKTPPKRIALILGLKTQAVYSLLSSAKRKIRALFRSAM